MYQLRGIKNLLLSILENFAYGFSGGIFAALFFRIEDYILRPKNISGFSVQDNQTIGILWIFLGLSSSAMAGNLLFGKTTKQAFLKWFFILTASSIAAVLMQMAFLIYHSEIRIGEIISNGALENLWELLGIRWMIRLFLILAPFTLLVANIRFLIKKIKSQNALR